MIRISRTPIIPIFCLVCVVCFGSLALFLFVRRGVLYDAALLSAKNRDMEDLKFQEERIREFQKIRGSHLFSQRLQSLENLFGDDNNPIEFLEFLEASARDLGLSVEIIPSAPQKLLQDPWTSMTFTIRSKGSYRQAMRFLESLDNAPHLLETREVNIAASKEQSEERVDFSFAVKLYTK